MNLTQAIDNYLKVLEEAKSPGIAKWKPGFLERCSEWCLFIEAEWLNLSPKEAESYLAKCPCEPDLIRDAHRVLFRTILENIYTPQDLYWSVLSNYIFLTRTQDRKELLLNDLSDMAQRASGTRLLQSMKDELDM